MSLYHKH